MAVRASSAPVRQPSSILRKWIRPLLGYSTVTLFTTIILVAFLSPFGYMAVTSVKDTDMITRPDAPFWPADEAVLTYEGQDYPIYNVPTEDGQVHEWALYKKGREASQFIDPANPGAGPIDWTGRWRTLEQSLSFSPRWENFPAVWEGIRMPLLLRNTIAIAAIGAVGTVVSSVAVAYGFSRFRIPGKGALFLILISTLMLPAFVTIVPTYALFYNIGWVGTWWPLILPHFFANAYNVFLLRQFFMTIPKEMDEAAMIDGASPVRTLLSIILPQAIPALISVALLHFVWAWNDYFMPLLYLAGSRDLQPIAIGIQEYNALYSFKPHLIQASAMLGLILPVVLFFILQRFFVRGITFTGVEK